jgi:hypothetical protein
MRRSGKEFGPTVKASYTCLLSSMDPVFEAIPTVGVFAGDCEDARWCPLVSTNYALDAFWTLNRGGYVTDGNERAGPLQLRGLLERFDDLVVSLRIVFPDRVNLLEDAELGMDAELGAHLSYVCLVLHHRFAYDASNVERESMDERKSATSKCPGLELIFGARHAPWHCHAQFGALYK